MNHTNRKTLTSTIWLIGITFYISLSMELFLFRLSDYNVYRVLNISFLDLFSLLLILIIQYLLLKKVPFHINTIWQSTKPFKKNKFLLLGILLSFCGFSAILPSQFPFWVSLIILMNLCFFTIITNNWKTNPFHKMMVLLLFGAGLNISLIFWMHEEANEGKHIRYAQQLAERQDTIAQNIFADFAELGKEVSSEVDKLDFWEKQWLSNPYLTANYRVSVTENISDSTMSFYQTILTFDEELTPVYKIFFPEKYTLNFKLNTNFRRSTYAPNEAFKKLKDLDDFQFVVVDQSKVALSNSHVFDPLIFDIELPSIGQGKKVELKGFDLLAYRHSKDTFVLIGEPLSEVQVWFSNFAFFFSLLLIVVIFLEIISLFILKKKAFDYWQELPIQFRIQILLIGVTCFLFFIIATTTFFFLHQNNSEISKERQLYMSETLRDEILEEKEQYNWTLNDFSVAFLSNLADRKQCDIDLYAPNGSLITSSFASAQNSLAPKNIDQQTIDKIKKNSSLILLDKRHLRESKEPYLSTYFGIFENNELEGIVSTSSLKSEIGTASYIPIVMMKLLNVYVFLLLIAWIGGLILIALLTKPLQLLANRLSNFKLGKQNEKLNWKGEDAIGQLISEYNKMVDKVELTTQELIRNEREGAWQVMAQQIAHEINNKLTPIRLKVQFLTRVIDGIDQTESEQIKGIANGLVEKIDGLSKIATQFKLFAKLDKPEIRKVQLDSYIEQFLKEYNKKESYQYLMKFEIEAEQKPLINIDTRHLHEVLNNIISNAENSIPDDREGTIKIKIKTQRKKVILEVEDNGNGIDGDIIVNLFDPKFSINSSQTGLGLPICKRIIEFYHGALSFNTIQGEGTTFIIEFSAN